MAKHSIAYGAGMIFQFGAGPMRNTAPRVAVSGRHRFLEPVNLSSVFLTWGIMLGSSAEAQFYSTKSEESGGETGIQPKHHIPINYM
jgi:hypothetical protein